MMQIELSGYQFIILSKDQIEHRSGVYAIIDGEGNKYRIILYVGESGDIQDRLSNHEKKNCWKKNAMWGLIYAVYYCDEKTRMKVEKELIEQLSSEDYRNLPCNKEA